MKLIALLVGLLVERLATQLFHLRRLRGLDRIIDAGFRQTERASNLPAIIPVLVLAVLLVSPVVLVMFLPGDGLYGFAYLIVAIIVLFFSLGPKDIGEQVDDYCEALEKGDEEAINHAAKALVERAVASDPMERIQQVEAAVCVQANNRLFAVIFWFILLGPLGAWGYRVTDLIRRRAVFNASRADGDSDDESPIVLAATQLHGWLAWIPARLTALGFALAGSFDSAIAAWRVRVDATGGPSEHSEKLLARVGVAALALNTDEEETVSGRGVRGAMAANALVFRLLGIWAVVIAAMTLYGASL
jgi:AmpE protein